jgi:hypothetical protein
VILTFFRFERHESKRRYGIDKYRPNPGGRSEHLLMPIELNSCPEITVYDSAPIRCRTASKASETFVRKPRSTRYFRNCSFMPLAVA